MLNERELIWFLAIFCCLLMTGVCAYISLWLKEKHRADKEESRRIELENRIISMGEKYEAKKRAKRIIAETDKFYKESKKR